MYFPYGNPKKNVSWPNSNPPALYSILWAGLINPSNGKIIISGVLDEDQEKISFFYKQAGFTEIECLFKNEWIAMVWQSRWG